jgi:hypothetical protein
MIHMPDRADIHMRLGTLELLLGHQGLLFTILTRAGPVIDAARPARMND